MTLLENTLGKERIALLHVNDTYEERGSKIDKHEIPGQGELGKKVLQRFIHHPLVRNVPLIIEPPALNDEQLRTVYQDVVGW